MGVAPGGTVTAAVFEPAPFAATVRTEPRGSQLAATRTAAPGWGPEPLTLALGPGVADQLLTKGTEPVADLVSATAVSDVGVTVPAPDT